ncbi:hypothetical protein SAMN06273572_105176 [Monaibacterium marinum]|uniref:RiboL-PSP-HEPN domain-containing protein n=1 Tax=Pontivivens marinum TaxID=1690039 RepID=A0A2C9CU06_9RHOB|nr:hypothetical protein SAMN06273572_105176 [Monaibacterium marinum]
MQRPSKYIHTDVPDWADTISMFGELRNHITHSTPTATEKLEKSCNIKGNMGFSFKSGDSIFVNLFHLMAIECFIDQYLNTLNTSLIDLAMKTSDRSSLQTSNQ